MDHPYVKLGPEYSDEWATMVVKSPNTAMAAANRLLLNRVVYEAAAAETGTPAIWLMATNERESGGKLSAYFGNGEPLSRVTRLVPRNRGPFMPPDAWVHGVKDALHLDGVDQVKEWTIQRAIFEHHLWNGWGPEAHGRRSGYTTAGTNWYNGGKYIADGVWDPNAWDQQLGTMPLMWAIGKIAPELALDHPAPLVDHVPSPPTVPSLPPVGVGGAHHDTRWLQAALNTVVKSNAKVRAAAMDLGGPDQIRVDGDYGRQTRLFVRALEAADGLDRDRGFAGPQVFGDLDKTLGPGWQPPA